jgi:hypothetical protein
MAPVFCFQWAGLLRSPFRDLTYAREKIRLSYQVLNIDRMDIIEKKRMLSSR